MLAGHVSEQSYNFHGGDWRDYEEQVADLFALVDLIPNRLLMQWQAVCDTQQDLESYVTDELRRYVPDWPDERVADRVRLRLTL